MRFYSLLLLFCLCACSGDAQYTKVAIQKQVDRNTYINAPKSHAAPSMAPWWRSIEDPIFQGYAEILLERNFDLQAGLQRIEQARATKNIQSGSLFPSLTANGTAGRSFAPSVTGNRTYSTNINPELSASWVLDLFGKIRADIAAADAALEASYFDQEALTHSLIAELFGYYTSAQTTTKQLELAKKAAENRSNQYALIKKRFDLGMSGITLSDVNLALSAKEAALSDVNQYKRTLAATLYAFDTILGRTPGLTQINDITAISVPLPDAPICLPADLLDRRPDLRASEARLKAANANIRGSIADLYPSLTLGGNIGYTGSELSDLFTADRLAGSILGTITAQLFRGGALRANVKLQEAEAKELAATYAGDVLDAMREVETALQAERMLAQQVERTQNRIVALWQAQNATQKRFDLGIASLSDLLDIQNQRYTAEQNLAALKQDARNVRTDLYLALGGDWAEQNLTGLNSCSRSPQK